EQARLLELLTKLGVELEQRARDAVTHRAGLTGRAAAVNIDHHVEFVDSVGQLQRLADDHAQSFVLEVRIDGGAVDFAIAAAGTQVDARRSALPPSSSVILHLSHVLKSLLKFQLGSAPLATPMLFDRVSRDLKGLRFLRPVRMFGPGVYLEFAAHGAAQL